MSNESKDAIKNMLLSFGVGKRNAAGDIILPKEMRGTPARVSTLWEKTLLKGEGVDLKKVLIKGSVCANGGDPIALTGIGVHLLCPHHLTVAFGEAKLAYIPGQRVAGFGALAQLVEYCTARLILQEEATRLAVDSLAEHLGVKAAYIEISATHPCHNLTLPRSHKARALTQASMGTQKNITVLKDFLRPR